MVKEVFVSTDMEADGPIPGPFSMLSLGSGAFTIDADQDFKIELVDQFSVNLIELPGATQSPRSMQFWAEHSEAWRKIRVNPIPPKEAMEKYLAWLKNLPGQVVFTAWPATYDFMFVYWYLMNFVGESPFEWSGLDMKSYYMGKTKQKSWNDMQKVPERWIVKNPLPHVAVNDAIEQGWMFCYMHRENLY